MWFPHHSHPHEQGGVCLDGAMEFTIGDETRIVRRGEGWMIPGGVTHSVRALEEGAHGPGCLLSSPGRLQIERRLVEQSTSQLGLAAVGQLTD